MLIKLVIIISFSILYCVFEVYLGIRNRKKARIEKHNDKGSLAALFTTISIGYFLSFTAASVRFGRIYHWNLLFATGFIIIMCGLIIRIRALKMLKQQFTYTVSKSEQHELVDNGIYKGIRHPGYLGQLLIFFGISVSLSNWLSILLMMIPVLAGYLYRISVEEKFMTEELGEKYINYKRRTKRLIPGIF